MGKRKRTAHAGNRNAHPKKARRAAPDQSPAATTVSVEHPVLSRLYPDLLSLRHYLLSRLPASSKLRDRRRKLSELGREHPSHGDTAPRGIDLELGELLDSTLVGVLPCTARRQDADKERSNDLESFSQEVLATSNSAGTFKAGYFLQAEVSRFDIGDVLVLPLVTQVSREGTVIDQA